jgi:uncharacterized membrane protein
MSDISQAPQVPVATDESARGTAIVAYVLYLIGWPTLHLSTVVAVILAYVKRDEARGTIWESHYDNIINTFWTTLVLGIVFGLLCIVLIGIPLIIALGVWFLYRAIKGLVQAIDNRPYL